MTDLEYMACAEQLLQAVEKCCDRMNDDISTDIDIDNQRTGGMVTLTFTNGSQIIINQQKPLHEIWMAAKSGGYHYRLVGAHWQCTKGSGEFFEQLSRDASAQSGLALRYSDSGLS